MVVQMQPWLLGTVMSFKAVAMTPVRFCAAFDLLGAIAAGGNSDSEVVVCRRICEIY